MGARRCGSVAGEAGEPGGMLPLHCAGRILASLAAEERRRLHLDALAEERARQADLVKAMGRVQRRERHLRQQVEFLETHGHPHLPRCFSVLEVERMNARRPAHAGKMERTQGGLLRDHCCFPSCPYFLVDLRTEKDRVLGTRNGLTSHLRFFYSPTYNYLPGLHATGKAFLARERHAQQHRANPTSAKKAFVQHMEKQYSGHQAMKDNAVEWRETFGLMFDQHHA